MLMQLREIAAMILRSSAKEMLMRASTFSGIAWRNIATRVLYAVCFVQGYLLIVRA